MLRLQDRQGTSFTVRSFQIVRGLEISSFSHIPRSHANGRWAIVLGMTCHDGSLLIKSFSWQQKMAGSRRGRIVEEIYRNELRAESRPSITCKSGFFLAHNQLNSSARFRTSVTAHTDPSRTAYRRPGISDGDVHWKHLQDFGDCDFIYSELLFLEARLFFPFFYHSFFPSLLCARTGGP